MTCGISSGPEHSHELSWQLLEQLQEVLFERTCKAASHMLGPHRTACALLQACSTHSLAAILLWSPS